MHFSHGIIFLAVLALIAGIVLMLSVITKSDEDLEQDRANTTRATLLLLASFSIAILSLVYHRYELADSVKQMFA